MQINYLWSKRERDPVPFAPSPPSCSPDPGPAPLSQRAARRADSLLHTGTDVTRDTTMGSKAMEHTERITVEMGFIFFYHYYYGLCRSMSLVRI